MALTIGDFSFNTSGASRVFRIGTNFGTSTGGVGQVTRTGDGAKFYNDLNGSYHMTGSPQVFINDNFGFAVTPLEGRIVLTGNTNTSEGIFINSSPSFLSRAGLYDGFHLEYNASYYDASNTLLHTASGFIYGGIQVNGNTPTLRNITRTSLYASSASLDNGNINVVISSGDVYLTLSSFTSAPAANTTVWTWTGWEYTSGYY